MNEFEQVLEQSLEALRNGASVESCLLDHPRHAVALRPHLEAAAAFMRAHASVAPREAFAKAARERFLVASGKRIEEAFDIEPSPSFFAAARVKFLMTAQRMGLGERARGGRRVPVFGTPFRAFGSVAAALALFLGATTYTVAQANDALPGEWQYNVKLQTERVRLALAFSDDAKRDVRLDIANERATEIQRMSAQGRIIGPDVLDRLVSTTAPLVEAANNGKFDRDEAQKLLAVAEKQKVVLAAAEPQVAPEAQPLLEQAIAVSHEGALTAASVVRFSDPDTPLIITPVIPLTQVTATDTPEPTATPEASETPDASATGEASPTAAPTRPSISVDETPVDDSTAGVSWIRLAVGQMTTLIPSEKDGWRIVGITAARGDTHVPAIVQLSNADGTSLVTLNPRNGDTYWYVAFNGRFDEVQLRMERDGTIYVADAAVLRRIYGDAADLPLYIVENIDIAPLPTATPEPEDTATPEPATP